MAPPTRTPRLGWVDAGLQALASGGLDAVRVEPLAKALGVTKGGFYHHFEDRPALLDEMLDVWEQRVIDEAITRVEAGGGTAREKLRRLFALAATFPDLLETELAIRDWSRRDPSVAERLRRVDNRRMDYLRRLIGEFCPDEDEVEVRALLVLSIFIGNNFIAAEHGARSRADVVRMALRRLEA